MRYFPRHLLSSRRLHQGRNTANTLSEFEIHDSKNTASSGFRLSSAIAPARQNQLRSSWWPRSSASSSEVSRRVPLASAQRFKVTLVRLYVRVHAPMLGSQKGVRPTRRSDKRNVPGAECERARRCCANLEAAPRLRPRRVLVTFEAPSLRRRRRNALTAGKMAPVAVDREWYQRVRRSRPIPIKIKNRVDERMT